MLKNILHYSLIESLNANIFLLVFITGIMHLGCHIAVNKIFFKVALGSTPMALILERISSCLFCVRVIFVFNLSNSSYVYIKYKIRRISIIVTNRKSLLFFNRDPYPQVSLGFSFVCVAKRKYQRIRFLFLSVFIS